MTDVLIFAVILAPIILAMVELIKRTSPIKNNLLPLTAFVVGLLIGFIAWPFTDLEVVMRLWAGGLAGLSATGLYELGSKSTEFAKGEEK
ncbi:holin [Sporosarcina sp. FSL K6-1540]|uniref:holin n=1 Tax=Sporosarcina sp. FSL K6-1540 TaxID=2921555 RepID=UPI00315AFFCE